MALIPAGDYTPLYIGDGGALAIRVPAFYLDVRPVTNADFLSFVRANPAWSRSRVPVLFAEAGYLESWAGDEELGPLAPADSPVVGVSWFAARAYANWKGKRLPTASEWERVAMTGFTTEHGASEAAYRDATIAWFSHPVATPLPAAGSGRPNFFGVRDMIGLVWEWVEDFNAATISSDPGGDDQLFCGGAAVNARKFTDYPAFLRAEFRGALRASYVVPSLGFRCAQSP
jgi:formylglycine-generating enzyme required for sulfatase activity